MTDHLDLEAVKERSENPPQTVNYSVCARCDKGKDPMTVPDTPCGHVREGNAMIVSVPAVPASDVLALISEVERLRALVERAEPFVRDALNYTGSPWCGSDEARAWLVDATAALSGSPTETKGENG